ncbi:hypothetical protein HAX54_026639, partial [Datura stramonium]|nr:hypothetical protein [Datura stramonium]
MGHRVNNYLLGEAHWLDCTGHCMTHFETTGHDGTRRKVLGASGKPRANHKLYVGGMTHGRVVE